MHNVMVEHRMNLIVQYQLYLFVKAFEQFQDDLLILQLLTVSNQAKRYLLQSNDLSKNEFLLHQEYLVEHDKLQVDIEQYPLHHLNKPNEEQYDHPNMIYIINKFIEFKKIYLHDLSFLHNPDQHLFSL
jgi:hypothetical protein